MFHTTVLLALAPGLLLIADFGGANLLSGAALALVAVHVCGSVFPPETHFVTLWMTVLLQALFQASNAFVVFGFTLRGCGLAAQIALHIFLLGVWATLQFPWMPADNPSFALTCERLLFALLPVTSTALSTWGAAELYGAPYTPFVLLVAYGVVLVLLGRLPSAVTPAATALRPKEAGTDGGACASERNGEEAEAPAMSTEALGAHACTLLALPPAYYLVLYFVRLGVEGWVGVVLLVAGAVLALSLLPQARLAQMLPEQMASRQAGAQVLALAASAFWVQRHSSHPWLRALAGRPPLQLLFAIAVGLASAPLLLLSLRRVPFLADGAAALVCSFVTGGLDLPLVYQGAALVAGLSGARGWRRKEPLALMLAGGASLAIVYAVLRTSTGFLDHTFGGSGVSLAALNAAVLGTVCLLALVGGSAVVSPADGILSLLGLLCHAVLLGCVEHALLLDDDTVYPATLLVASVGTGLLLCERLYSAAAPPPTLWWLLLGLTVGRATPLLAASGRPSPQLSLATVTLTLALSQRLHATLARRSLGVAAEASPIQPPELLARLLVLAAAVGWSHTTLLPEAAERYACPLSPPVRLSPPTSPAHLCLRTPLYSLLCSHFFILAPLYSLL